MLQLFIFKVNIKTLGKFDAISITWCQYYYASLLILILCIYIEIESVDDNQEFYSNDEENRLKLGDIPFKKILEN